MADIFHMYLKHIFTLKKKPHLLFNLMLDDNLKIWEGAYMVFQNSFRGCSSRKVWNHCSSLTIFNLTFSIIPTSSRSYWFFSLLHQFQTLACFSKPPSPFLLLVFPWGEIVLKWLFHALSYPCVFYCIIPLPWNALSFSLLFILTALHYWFLSV